MKLCLVCLFQGNRRGFGCLKSNSVQITSIANVLKCNLVYFRDTGGVVSV